MSENNERKRFQYYSNSSQKEDGVYPFYLKDENITIIGTEFVSEGTKLVFYFLPIKENEALLMMCVDKDAELDTVLNDMSEYDMTIYRRPWPKLITAIENGIKGRLHLPSLIALDIHSRRSYFISLLLSNIKIFELKEMYNSDYVLGKVSDMVDFINQMFAEMSDNDLTLLEKAKVYGASILGQVSSVAKIVRVINVVFN